MKASIALLISGLAAQQVAATWNRQASNYNTPQYNNNECSDKQKGGYNWGDLSDGDRPGSYDDFDFDGGWSCSTKFGKRDHLSKRSFGDKCITNKVKKDKPASFGCDRNKKKDGFSVTHIDVSVDHDAELDFHYKMRDGSICKQRASCKKDGTTVQNTQCGGAESVDVYLGNSSEGREDCEIGFHDIGFDCNPPTDYTPPPPYTPGPPPESSTEVSEVPSSSTEIPSTSSEVPQTTPPPETTESPEPPQSTSESISTPPTCGEGYGPGCGGYNSTAPPPPATTPPPPASIPSEECGGYGQPACETATPPPAEESSSEVPPTSSAEVPSSSADSSEPPSEPTPPPSECGNGYGQSPCEETPSTSSEIPPTSSAEVPSTSADSNEPPSEPTPPPSECGNGYGQSPCEETPSTPAESTPAESTPAESTPPPAATPPPSEECGGYGQPACEETPSETPVESTPVESTAESTPPPAATPPPSEECGNGYGQSPCEESSTASPPEPTPPTSSNGTVPETPVSSSPPTYTPPPGGYTPPECLPKCLNTWLKLKTECKDNTDSECYCKVPDLTDNVIDCVKAYGTEEEVQQALSFFVGICAPHVPENPGIIDKCTDVPLAPPTPAPETPKTTAAAVTPAPGEPTPAPTPTPEQPVEIPYTTVTYGGNEYTVPQVGFTTEAPDAPGANPTEPIALYPAPSTPAPAPANPTAPYPTGPSGFTSVSYPTGTGAPLPSAPSEFQGAASSLKIHGLGVVFGAILAVFAL